MRISTIRDVTNSLDIRYGISENSDAARRFLVFANGRTEWIEKYEHVPRDLKINSETGFLSFDHRGQGASGGARAWINDYDVYAKDMALVIEKTTKGQPYNIICHSMGGLISMVAIMRGLIKPRCVVLSSPLLAMPNHPMPAPAAYQAARMLTNCHMGHLNTGGGRHSRPPFERNILTHSAENYSKIKKTPFPVPSPTFEWVKASYEATQFIQNPENLAKVTMPVLVLCGTEEKVVDSVGIQRWVSTAAQVIPGKVDFHWIQGGYHELLFESQTIYLPVIELIRSWFDGKGFPL